MSENKDVFNVASIDSNGMDVHKTMYELLPNDSKLRERLGDVAVEIGRARTDKEYNYLLKDDELFSTTRRLRHQFWNIFNQTVGLRKSKIAIPTVYAGIVSKAAFYKILECDIRATYILSQPHDIKTIQRDLLYEGYRYLDEIMAIPVVDALGRPDHKVIQTKLNIIKMMEDRISGSVVQREQKYIENVSKGDKPMESQENLNELRAEVDRLKLSMGKQIEEADFKEIK